jgi:hypothetical protein
MADLPQLVTIQQLKSTLIRKLMAQQTTQTSLFYDDSFDALIVRYVPRDQRTVVFHVDDHVAFLVLPDSLEIVGFQIEDFERGFLPSHNAVMRLWQLRETDQPIESVGDLIITATRLTPRVVREVVRAAREGLDAPASELLEAMI